MDFVFISEFFGDGEYKERESVVKYMGNTLFHVEMYDAEGLCKVHKLKDCTVQYAENCAENWVLGVIKE
jgi:hypothetical protein